MTSRIPGIAILVLCLCALHHPANAAGPRAHVQPFDLRQVRLLDGPLNEAAKRNQAFLRGLELDRLLHNFRVTAGLPSSAEPLGGWETPDVELRGHFVGHYLSACALMYASCGDSVLKAKADTVVAELAKCQNKFPSGYLSAFSEELIDRVEAGKPVWAPWYTLHKIYQGLIDMYMYTGNAQALDIVRKMAAWTKSRMDRLSNDQMQVMLQNEFGGMSESLFNLYAITNNREHLVLAQRFEKRSFLGPLEDRTDRLKGLHVNTHIPQAIGAARGYELTGESRYQTIATFFWDQVVRARSYATGGTSNGECWKSEPYHLATELSATTEETCCSYNMLKLTSHLFSWNPDPEYADYYERTFFNSILPSQDPATGMLMYYKPLGSGWYKTFGTPRNSFWCCTGTGIESFGRLASGVYYHDDGGIYVNLFIPSELRWEEKGITLRQETSFPENARTRLIIDAPKPVELNLNIRIPEWSSGGARVTINGKETGITSSPSSFLILHRTWHNGDRVEIEYTMNLHLWPMPDNPSMAAVMYGPIVLAGKLQGGVADTLRYGPSGPTTPPVPAPVFVVNGPIDSWIEKVPGKALTFRTKGAGIPRDVGLVPLGQLADDRYAVYWNIFTRDEWEKAKRESAGLAGKLVDRILVGDTVSVNAHNLAGSHMQSGSDAGRHWLTTTDWISLSMKVLIDRPATLRFTYPKADSGHAYAVALDEIPLEVKPAITEAPDGIIQEEYEIPLAMTQGKQTAVISFQTDRKSAGKKLLSCEMYGSLREK